MADTAVVAFVFVRGGFIHLRTFYLTWGYDILLLGQLIESTMMVIIHQKIVNGLLVKNRHVIEEKDEYKRVLGRESIIASMRIVGFHRLRPTKRLFI